MSYALGGIAGTGAAGVVDLAPKVGGLNVHLPFSKKSFGRLPKESALRMLCEMRMMCLLFDLHNRQSSTLTR